jgi:hypothetical protein
MNFNISLYRNIGYLTYAIATTYEGNSKECIQLMKNDLIKSWYFLTRRNIEDDSETYIQTELIFNWLLSHGFSSTYAWDSFTKFVQNHSHEFEAHYKEDLLLYSSDISSKLYTNDQSDHIIEKVSKILSL